MIMLHNAGIRGHWAEAVCTGAMRDSLVHLPALTGGHPVEEVVQQVGHEHPKADWVNQAQRVHTLAVVACQHARDEGSYEQQQAGGGAS